MVLTMDSHSWVLWVGVFAAVLHVLEEHAEGWVAWANEKLGPRFGVTFSVSLTPDARLLVRTGPSSLTSPSCTTHPLPSRMDPQEKFKTSNKKLGSGT